MSTTNNSERAFARARAIIAGGVNSPVRAFRAVGGTPRFIANAKGCRLTDLDGQAYIDYVMSWGPLILGHAHPEVLEAIQRAAQRGTSYGAPTEAESELGENVRAMMPSIERIRFTSSGTEATMSALRLARAYTHREKIIKFAGCYHGHADAFLISAGSGALTNGTPDSPGIPDGVVRDTIVLPYNDIGAIESVFAACGDKVAAIIIEPYVGNMGLVLPHKNYLQTLRDISAKHGALLIFDEVMTGFRVGPGGVQGETGIFPDLTTLGKVIGGGLPVGAFGGRAEIMELLSPVGAVYQAGTLSGNPLAMAAGIATLRHLQQPGIYERLNAATERLIGGLSAVFARHRIAAQTAHAGSMFGFFLSDTPVTDLSSAKRADTKQYARLFHALLERGVWIAPAQFEAGFVSLAHTDADIDETLAAWDNAALTCAVDRAN